MEKKDQYHDFEMDDLQEQGVYPYSIVRIDNNILFMAQEENEDKIIVLGPLKKQFMGTNYQGENSKILVAPINKENAERLREVLSFTAPHFIDKTKVNLSLPIYCGLFSDKFYHLLTNKKISVNFCFHKVSQYPLLSKLFPVSFEEIIDEITFKSFREGYLEGYGISKDSCPFNTIKSISITSWNMDLENIELDSDSEYLSQTYRLADRKIKFSEKELTKCIRKTNDLINQLKKKFNSDDLQHNTKLVLDLKKLTFKEKFYLLNELRKNQVSFDFLQYDIVEEDFELASYFNQINYFYKLIIDEKRWHDLMMNENVKKIALYCYFDFQNEFSQPLLMLLLKNNQPLLEKLLLDHLSNQEFIETLKNSSRSNFKKLMNSVQGTMIWKQLYEIIVNSTDFKEIIKVCQEHLNDYKELYLNYLEQLVKKIS